MSRTFTFNQQRPIARSAVASRVNAQLRRQHESQKLCAHKRITMLESGFGVAVGCVDCGSFLGMGPHVVKKEG